MIGIIGAMGVEINTLLGVLENRETQVISGITYSKGTIYGKEVVLAVCGVGKVFAAICTQTMILNYAPEVIINTGVAGALSDRLTIGDIVVADAVLQHDMDTTPLGDPPGLISGINMVKFPTDEETRIALKNAIRAQNINCYVGTVATGDKFLASPEVKETIRNTFDALAGEMEGGAVGHVCYVNNIKFCVLRAISDCADGTGAKDYMKFLKAAAQNAAAVVLLYIKEYKK